MEDCGNGHMSYRFFRLGECFAIPASSLRGMVRSVYEAITNSCFNIFAYKRRLTYHMETVDAAGLTPARLERRGKSWYLWLLPGTSNQLPGKPAEDIKPAAWILRYLKKTKNLKGKNSNSPYHRRPPVEIPPGLGHGDHCWAVMAKNNDTGPQAKAEEHPARAGMLRFTGATLVSDEKPFPEPVTLNVLSYPKPTTAYFYLCPKNGEDFKVENFKEIIQKSYDAEAWIRGRKFYRHHRTVKPEEYRLPGGKEKDEQSRTLRDVMSRGARFSFDIFFNNLSEVELEAFLWCLTLGGKACHRLGYARPFGFGSVKITVEKVELLNSVERYTSQARSGYHEFDETSQQRH